MRTGAQMLRRKTEFITLMACLMAMVALSIDAMLPALSHIAADLQLANDNDRQLIITVIFAGLALGQFIYGPLSDSIGRKPVVVIGLLVFLFGSLVCVLADTFWLLLMGRFLQGVGAAASRNIATAIVRDGFKGNEMARIMSIIMAVFVLIPMLAPALGQVILWFASWRVIFLAFMVLAVLLLLWFIVRQEETLKAEHRRPFSFAMIFAALKEVLSNKAAITYTMVSGIVFGAFMSFLSSSQQLLQDDYGMGDSFALAFAGLAFAFCLALMVNSRYVMRLGAANMARIALIAMMLNVLIFAVPIIMANGLPSVYVLMLFLFVCCFTTGLLLGNVSALAMEPLGHIAGTASAIVGGLSTLVAGLLGSCIGQAYAGNVYPFLLAFFVCGSIALGLSEYARRLN